MELILLLIVFIILALIFSRGIMNIVLFFINLYNAQHEDDKK